MTAKHTSSVLLTTPNISVYSRMHNTSLEYVIKTYLCICIFASLIIFICIYMLFTGAQKAHLVGARTRKLTKVAHLRFSAVKMAAEAIRMSVLRTHRQQRKRATAYTLVKDLKWILPMLNVLGILPIFKVVHAYKIALPKRQSFASLYTSLVRLFGFVALLLYMYIVYSPYSDGVIFIYDEMDNATIGLHILLGIVSCGIILWKSARKSQNFIIVINQLLSVDKELQQYPHAPKALENNCAFHKRYTCLLLLHTVAICAIKWLDAHEVAYSVFSVGLYFFYIQLHTIINGYVIFVATLLHLLAVRFKYLNDFIKIYTRRQDTHESVLRDRIKAYNVESALEIFSADMLFFYRTHNNLLAIFRKLNDFVHTTLLAFIAYFFYTSTLSAYQFYLAAKLDNMNIRLIGWCIIFLCTHWPIAALLMRQSDAVTKEVIERVYKINEFLFKYPWF